MPAQSSSEEDLAAPSTNTRKFFRKGSLDILRITRPRSRTREDGDAVKYEEREKEKEQGKEKEKEKEKDDKHHHHHIIPKLSPRRHQDNNNEKEDKHHHHHIIPKLSPRRHQDNNNNDKDKEREKEKDKHHHHHHEKEVKHREPLKHGEESMSLEKIKVPKADKVRGNEHQHRKRREGHRRAKSTGAPEKEDGDEDDLVVTSKKH